METSRTPLLQTLARRAPWLIQGFLFVLARVPAGTRARHAAMSAFMGRTFDTVNHGDALAVVPVACEPDFELRLIGFPLGIADRRIGAQGVVDFLEEWTVALGLPRFTVEEVFDLGDGLLATVIAVSAGQSSGLETRQRGGFLVRYSRRGRVALLEIYFEREEALAAAGVSSPAPRSAALRSRG